MLRQILQTLQSFNDLRDEFNNMATKFEALQDSFEATTQATEAKVVDIKAGIEATAANFAAFLAELQAANEEAACMDRKLSKLEAAVANAAARFPQRRRAGRAEPFKNGRVARR